MSEFQKPYSANVTEAYYRSIFRPVLSCEGCFWSWKTKDTFPCRSCVRVLPCMRYEFDGELRDCFTTEYKEDQNHPDNFK